MKAIATLLLCLVTAGASAQPVYRCGNTYSRIPCPDGRIVDATDARTAAQRAEARRVAADERRLAAELRRERLADERAIKPAGAISLSGPPPAKAAAAAGSPQKKKRGAVKPAASADFVVRDPRKPRIASD